MALILELTYTYLNCRFFLKRFSVCRNLFVLFFAVAPCLVVTPNYKKIIKKIRNQSHRKMIFIFTVILTHSYLPYATLVMD